MPYSNSYTKNVDDTNCNRIAEFQKVSFAEFQRAIIDILGQVYQDKDNLIKDMYERVSIPSRATKGSAGYDFITPFGINLYPGETIKIPTGIKVKIDDGWVLQIYPRSSLGFKYRTQLDNTVGIIDSDYYNSDNEGHIFIKLTNDSKEEKTINISAGQKIVQGIFYKYGITYNDDNTKLRHGGIGSTGE
ncbi:MAG: deoxyuridine 5'-triphosphate nucleotidohydrolase [Lachnospiraceae bacterium]|nr:deoxyuridine 5'-triphosphate nucleotidohydrolase [Lachnospiraceae bacterium]